ncbi:MAG: hypothetical protein ACYC27_10670 [Armatimonadota bacterium]
MNVNIPSDTNPAPKYDDIISRSDRLIIRELASKVAELAARDIEAEKRKLWTMHNGLKPTRPLIFCDPENGWNEIITPDQMQCVGPLARAWEYHFRREIFWGEHMKDDRVIQSCFNIGWAHTRTDWGLREQNIGGEHGGARTWIPPINDIDDLSGLHFQTITIDHKATEDMMDIANDVLGDLLTVRLRGAWFWSLGLTWEVIKLRGMEQMMLDMYENPEGLHNLMAFLRDGTMDFINTLEKDHLFSLNNEGDYVGSGAFGWSDELPVKGFAGNVRTRDMWCLSESQETVGVSPEMFEEFIFPYQLPLMERFGLICYGCCEPVHTRWHVIKQIPNLRRVSVSPWCDRELMAEYLGSDYIFSLKPNPSLLAGVSFNEELIRADIRDALDKAKGCHLEVVMKDNHTICGDPGRATNWVRIVREEIDKSL